MLSRGQHTELGTRCCPRLDNGQATLAAHEANVSLAVLVRVKPVNFLTLGNDIAVVHGNILLGPDEESMPCRGLFFQFGHEVPVLLVKQLVFEQSVGILQAVDEELAEQLVTGMICVPDLISVVGNEMAVHANQQAILWPQSRGPSSKVTQSCRPRIIAQYRAEGQEQTRRQDLANVVQSVLKCTPKTATLDDGVGAGVVLNQAR